MPGTARDEAERLIATVLAMAGAGGHQQNESLWGTAQRVTAGLGALGTVVTDAVNGLAAAASQAGADRSGDESTAASHAGGDRSGDDSTAASHAGGDRSGGAGHAVAGGGAAGGSGPHGAGGVVRQGWSTGSAECCVCPLCRVIATLRDPTPEAAERLAGAAGDAATAVAALLRAVSAMAGAAKPKPPARPAPPTPDEAWSIATRKTWPAQAPVVPDEVLRETDVWAAAAKAPAPAEASADQPAPVKRRRRVPVKSAPGGGGDGEAGGGQSRDASGASVPRTADGLEYEDRAPRSGDVWAAAVADQGRSPVAPATAVDHDVAGA